MVASREEKEEGSQVSGKPQLSGPDAGLEEAIVGCNTVVGAGVNGVSNDAKAPLLRASNAPTAPVRTKRVTSLQHDISWEDL